MSEVLRLVSRLTPWFPLVLGIAAFILFLAVLLIQVRVSRISNKLDFINLRLDQLNRALAEQTMYLQRIADAVRPAPAPAPAVAARATYAGRAEPSAETGRGKASERRGGTGPFEL
jgi:hypothetical protein